MNTRTMIPAELALGAGIILDAAGVALITKSNFGITAISALPYTLSQVFPTLTYGTWYYIFQISLMAILCLITKRFKKDYIIAFIVGFLFSFALDIISFLIEPWPELLLLRGGYFIAGTLLLMVGVGFLINSGLPIMPQDLFTRDLSTFKDIPYKRFKTAFDLSCVIVSLSISLLLTGHIYGIGICTLLSACINGYGISWFQQRQKRVWDFPIRWKAVFCTK